MHAVGFFPLRRATRAQVAVTRRGRASRSPSDPGSKPSYVSKKPSTVPPRRLGTPQPHARHGTGLPSTMRQTRRTPPPSCTRGAAGCRASSPTLAPRARVGGRPRRRCTQSAPSAPPREVNNPSRSKAWETAVPSRLALDTDDPLAPLRRDPAAAGIFSDFDGTLSPIVEDPRARRACGGSSQTPRRAGPALCRRGCRLGSPGRLPRRPPARFGPAGGAVRPGSAVPRQTADRPRS